MRVTLLVVDKLVWHPGALRRISLLLIRDERLHVEPELDRIASPIRVTTVRDVDDAHDDSFVEDLVDHPEFAPPGAVSPLQLIAERLADTVGVICERTANEFPTGDGDGFG
jgi:hypothetical protein